MVRLVRHRPTKGPATDRPHLHHRATSRLHKSGGYGPETAFEEMKAPTTFDQSSFPPTGQLWLPHLGVGRKGIRICPQSVLSGDAVSSRINTGSNTHTS